MSYKKRKLKKRKINQLLFKVGLVWNWILKNKVLLQINRRKNMRLPQTQKIVEALRFLNRTIDKNNKRIDEWVDNYINDCILNGRPVEILLQWCSGLGLEQRMKRQGNQFVPLQSEIDLVQKEILKIINIFIEQNVKISWIVTFNRSYIKRRKLPDSVFFAYITMIKGLAIGIKELEENVLFLDWEELVNEIKPNQEILINFDRFVNKKAMEYEITNFLQMLKQYPDALASEEDLRCEAKERIAYESEEALFLAGTKSPFTDGKFILIPLEKPERYVW